MAIINLKKGVDKTRKSEYNNSDDEIVSNVCCYSIYN
nr:MAG TPA: hypothetical protein [Caudoviricetes sp.]